MLCARGADPNARDLSDLDALHLAAEKGWSEVLDVLVRDCRADVLARSSNGRTAMHHCAYMNHEDSVTVLLKFMTERGMMKGVPFYDDRFVEPLLKNDFSQLADNWGKTPVDLAAEKGHRHLVRLMEAPRRRESTEAQKPARPDAGEPAQEHRNWTPRKWTGFGPIGGAGGGGRTKGSTKDKGRPG